MGWRENNIARCREKRVIAKEEGLCGLCFKREAILGETRCGACADRQDEYKAKRKEAKA